MQQHHRGHLLLRHLRPEVSSTRLLAALYFLEYVSRGRLDIPNCGSKTPGDREDRWESTLHRAGAGASTVMHRVQLPLATSAHPHQSTGWHPGGSASSLTWKEGHHWGG